MAKIEIWTGPENEPIHVFECPGCKCSHGVWIDKPHRNGAQWQFNGNFNSPTITPSVLIRYGKDQRCHLFVTDGKIRYLGDCTHELKGQTIEMKDLNEDSPDTNNVYIKYRKV